MTTFKGELSNTGQDPTPPIEVYAAGVKKDLGVIPPGKSAKYSIRVDRELGDVHADFRAEGKPLAVHNAYAFDLALDALVLAIDAHARLGVWVEHFAESDYGVSFLVHLTADQAALDDRARAALFKPVMETLAEHRKKSHSQARCSGPMFFAAPGGGGKMSLSRARCIEYVLFAAPGGGGWLAEGSTEPKRFEGDAEAQFK